MHHRAQRHAAGHRGADHRGNGGAVHAQRREPKMPADEQIVAHNIHQVRGDVCAHGNPCAAHAALRGIDYHVQHIKNLAAHNDAKISRGKPVRILVGAGKPQRGLGQQQRRRRNNGGKQHRKQNCLPQHAVCALTVSLALAPRHNGADGNVDGKEQRKADKLRLVRQPDGRNGRSAQRGNHNGIHHTDERHQKRFQRRGPRHAQRAAQQRGVAWHLAARGSILQNAPRVEQQRQSPIHMF